MRKPDIGDAAAKFISAINALATLPISLQERLITAFLSGLNRLETEGLTPELADRWEHLFTRLTSNPNLALGDAPVHGTVRAMNDDEARDVASELMLLARAVWQEAARQEYQGR